MEGPRDCPTKSPALGQSTLARGEENSNDAPTQNADEELMMLNAGDPAPEFSVVDDRGRTVTLSEQRGKNVVLWFYPKADTPG